MRKSVFTLCLLLVWSVVVLADDPVESTSTATITFFRTPSSLLPGIFSVSETKRVSFARGNLQYLASQNLWRFAEHQYDFIGNAVGNTTAEAYRATQGNWIDYFGWGTSGWSGGDNYSHNTYQPWAISTTNSHYGPTLAHMAAEHNWAESASTKNYDWGVYNFTSGPDKGYYVMSKEEWEYLLETRDPAGNENALTLKGQGAVFGITGLFLLPDNWDWTEATIAAAVTAAGFTWTAGSATYVNNRIRDDADGHTLWEAMEAAGAVFLPATGYFQNGATVSIGDQARYHTSTVKSAEYMYALDWKNGTLVYVDPTCSRALGRSVRLAKTITE